MLQGAALTLVVIAVLAGATAVMDGNPAPGEATQAPRTASVPDGEEWTRSPSPTPSQRPRADGDDAGQWWVLLVLGVVAVGIGVRIWMQRPPQVVVEDAEPDPEPALSDALERLDEEPVEAITMCWRELERLAAARGVERAASEPAHDFARRLATVLHLPADAVTALGGLYEQAWYSIEAATSEDIERARACLDVLVKAAGGRGR